MTSTEDAFHAVRRTFVEDDGLKKSNTFADRHQKYSVDTNMMKLQHSELKGDDASDLIGEAYTTQQHTSTLPSNLWPHQNVRTID